MTAPEVIIRMGTHAEKEYVNKTARFFDGVFLAANLLEATPRATTSLAIQLSGKVGTRVYLDPMTYAYGAIVDPQTREPWTDLEWLRSEVKIPKAEREPDGPTTRRQVKRSYRRLADEFGGVFKAAVERGSAVEPADLQSRRALDACCKAVGEYQANRFRGEFEASPELARYADHVPSPAVLFAPYFYATPGSEDEWLSVALDLMKSMLRLFEGQDVAGVLCAEPDFLLRGEVLERVLAGIRGAGLHSLWIWLSKFPEEEARSDQLHALRDFVHAAAKETRVYNLHGSFFSLALAKHGMSGISHGVGYGEQKDVVPVVGQSTPTVSYYVPPIRRRIGIPELLRSLASIGIETPQQFWDEICGCAICRGVLKDGIEALREFGDLHYSRPESRRQSQTPAAAKRCRFHFLLSRLEERNWVREASLGDIVASLEQANEVWGPHRWIYRKTGHLEAWISALSP